MHKIIRKPEGYTHLALKAKTKSDILCVLV